MPRTDDTSNGTLNRGIHTLTHIDRIRLLRPSRGIEIPLTFLAVGYSFLLPVRGPKNLRLMRSASNTISTSDRSSNDIVWNVIWPRRWKASWTCKKNPIAGRCAR